MNFAAKFLRTTFLQNTSGRLLLSLIYFEKKKLYAGLNRILNIVRTVGTVKKTATTVFKLYQELFTCKKSRTFDDN